MSTLWSHVVGPYLPVTILVLIPEPHLYKIIHIAPAMEQSTSAVVPKPKYKIYWCWLIRFRSIGISVLSVAPLIHLRNQKWHRPVAYAEKISTKKRTWERDMQLAHEDWEFHEFFEINLVMHDCTHWRRQLSNHSDQSFDDKIMHGKAKHTNSKYDDCYYENLFNVSLERGFRDLGMDCTLAATVYRFSNSRLLRVTSQTCYQIRQCRSRNLT